MQPKRTKLEAFGPERVLTRCQLPKVSTKNSKPVTNLLAIQCLNAIMENRLLVTAPVMDPVVVVRHCKTGELDLPVFFK